MDCVGYSEEDIRLSIRPDRNSATLKHFIVIDCVMGKPWAIMTWPEARYHRGIRAQNASWLGLLMLASSRSTIYDRC